MTLGREDAAVGRRTRLLRIFLGAYIVATGLVAYWPKPVDGPIDPNLLRVLAWLQRHGVHFMTYHFVEFTANIGFFMPLGFLIAALLPARRWWLAIVICFGATCCIEIGQGLFLPDRVASVGDVVANTTGGILGAAIAWVVFVRRRSSSRSTARVS
jgi:VanZ family protein